MKLTSSYRPSNFMGNFAVESPQELVHRSCHHSIRRGEYAYTATGKGPIKVLNWNIDHGLDDVIDLIEREKPALCLLQKVDLNARRSAGLDIADLMARYFALNYVWGAESEEPGQGSTSNPAFYGHAILTTLTIRSSRILHLSHKSGFLLPRWLLADWPGFQRRRGGRIALIAELDWNGQTLVVCNIHLENHGPEGLCEQQLEEILTDLSAYPNDSPLIVAGDFNTKCHPSPLVQRLKEAEFRDAVDLPGQPIQDSRLGCVFVRGCIHASEGKVHDQARASDHFAVSAVLSSGEEWAGSPPLIRSPR